MLFRSPNKQIVPSSELVEIINKSRRDNYKILLLTAHRRESFENGLKEIFLAARKALHNDSKLLIIHPIHPNPLIWKILEETKLNLVDNIKIMSSLPYQDMVYLLNSVDGVLTDSGGVQEEAVGLNKPVLVLRNETARQDGIQAGFCEIGRASGRERV